MTPNRQMEVARPEPELRIAAADARIAWVLDHPQMDAAVTKQAIGTPALC